jgi:lipopolysaccharide export system protein LptA
MRLSYKKLFQKISSINKPRYILFVSVLGLFISFTFAQIRPKQLRKEVLESRSDKVKQANNIPGRSKRKPKPLPTPKPLAPILNPLANKNVTLIYLENSEAISFNQQINPDVQILKGNVRFRHDNAVMYCDSAYFYEKANSLDAYGHVKIVQADTLFVFGDFLFYDGNTKLARLRKNVKMINHKTTLTTDSLNFDRMTNLAYYYTGGKIADPENTLTSVWGQYNTSTNDALFRNNVIMVNKNFTMTSDSLLYNTKTKIANIVSPTKIVYQGETVINSSRGWYNTLNERSMMFDRSTVNHKDGKMMVGDTVFYDKKNNFGEAFTNVILTDTVNKSTLYGDYVYYDEKSKNGLATDSALLVDWSSKDTMYIHADTLSRFRDSIYDHVKAYYHVRFFRNDLQGICDSMFYNGKDSVIYLHYDPILWSDNNQLSGDLIKIFTKNKKVNKVDIQDNAITIQYNDSVYYNQLSGKEIIAHVDSNQLKKIDVNGNAETIFYPVDDADSSFIGMNKTKSSYVVMYLKNKKIDRVVLTSASEGVMHPLDKLKDDQLYLKNFFWIENVRPRSKADLFLIFPKIEKKNPALSPPKEGDIKNKENKEKGLKPLNVR